MDEQDLKISSKSYTVETLFSGQRNFFIPRFQRPYSWDDDNITQFWNDVTSGEQANYFIGSMVSYTVGKHSYALVDGQQRITTIMILLCCLRDTFAQLEDRNKADALHGFIEFPDRDNNLHYTLQTETSFPYLQDEILKFGKPDLNLVPGREESSIKSAAAIFTRSIKKKLDRIDTNSSISEKEKLKRKIQSISKIRDYALELSLILITLTNEEDAYFIFETLNTRGKDLALGDLLKNHFSKNINKTGDVDIVKEKWSSLQSILLDSGADIDPDTFFVNSWQSRFKSVTKAKAFGVMKDTIDNKNALEHLNDFIEDANHYRTILEPDSAWNNNQTKVKNSLNALLLFRVKQPIPAVLSLVRAFKNKRITMGKLAQTLSAIENFHFAFTAITSSRSSGGISGMYTAFGRRLYEAESGNDANKEILSLIKKLRDRMPTFAEFEAALPNVIYTNKITSQKNLVRYFLNKLNIEEKNATNGDFVDLSIEHLFPQKKITSDKRPAEIIGQLGNMFLVDEALNERLGTKNFEEKKRILIEAGYTIGNVLVSADNLSNEVINKNTKRIALVAYEKIWNIK